MKDATRCVRHSESPLDGFASLTVPTYRASTIVFKDAEEYARRKDRGPDGYTYGMNGTPTSRTLEAQLTELHRGERSVILPSGQAAITVIMLSVLRPGDCVLIPDAVYPPVRNFCQNYLASLGIDHAIYDPVIGARISESLNDRVKLVWIESPGSTTLEIQDVAAIASAAHAAGALVGCDNTWASPLLFKPLEHGVDFVMEALTKYVGGHSDLLLGSVTVSQWEHFAQLRATMSALGFSVSPDECSLALRGIETMAVRITHVGAVAERIARRLASTFSNLEVLHPALPSFKGHELWKRDFEGASGVFSIVLPRSVGSRVNGALGSLQTFAIGASWGGTRSLLAPMSVEGERDFGPYGDDRTIIRVSIGLEHEDELWEDLHQVFDVLRE
ncbi:trans-sulfuration enzyme family protein [Mesorhizobium sp. A623]